MGRKGYWTGKKMPLAMRKKMSVARRKHALVDIPLTKEFLSILNGELLGDGSLRCEWGFQGRYKHDNKHKSYIVWLRNEFKKSKLPVGKIYERLHSGAFSKRKVITYSFYSGSTKQFGDLYRKWYPNGKKIIPNDLKLNKLMLRHWYLGDGTLVKTSGRNKNNKCIKIYTDAFLKSDILRMIKQIRNLVGVSPTYQKSRNNIFIKNDEVKKFLDFLGRSPVKCYQYKFEL